MTHTLVTRYDSTPAFWQLLNTLREDDIIAELIQNDLDAGATETTFDFTASMLRCEGNGRPIDADGWVRLSYITGAGEDAPRKKNCIGVKNHGLKACFRLGNEIHIRSDKQYTLQTLQRDGRDKRPYPGTLLEPVEDPDAPVVGCRIEVPYRLEPLFVTTGEPLTIPVVSQERLRAIFLETVREIPRRFIGVMRPGYRRQYTLTLSHHELGQVRFEFRCTGDKVQKGLTLYRRTCQVTGTLEDLPPSIIEEAAACKAELPERFGREIPEFFQAGKRFWVEVAWETNTRGRPQSAVGMLRYPIAYHAVSNETRTGLGFHFSAPFMSDLERHEAVESDLNTHLLDSCNALILRVLTHVMLPAWGAPGLAPLVDPTSPSKKILQEMVMGLLENGACPVVTPDEFDSLLTNGRKKKSASGKVSHGVQLGPRVKNGTVDRLVIPIDAEDALSARVNSVCISRAPRLDPRVPSAIAELLIAEMFSDHHMTFDAHDVFALLTSDGNDFYGWRSAVERTRLLADPEVACSWLDVVAAAWKGIEEQNKNEIKEKIGRVSLPDTTNVVRRLKDLRIGSDLPEGLPGRTHFAFVHGQVAAHPMLKTWDVSSVKFEDYLAQVDWRNVRESHRKAFWSWLCKNPGKVPSGGWSALQELPIWRTAAGTWVCFNNLCAPPRKAVREVLAGVLSPPAPELSRLICVKGSRSRPKLRISPTPAEITAWVNQQLLAFPRDSRLSDAAVRRFHQFEKEMAALAEDEALAETLGKLTSMIPALSMAGVLRPAQELHLNDAFTRSLALLHSDVINRKVTKLNTLFPPRKKVSTNALIAALSEDPMRESALIPRLKVLLTRLKEDNIPLAKTNLLTTPIIPDGERLLPPSNAAFAGRVDYWGQWKTPLTTKYSAEAQAILREIGVTAGEPTSLTSFSFFLWLSTQAPDIIRTHLPVILRHAAHREGTSTWALDRVYMGSISMEQNGGVRLISINEARGGRVFIPDNLELAEAIRKDPSATVGLCIDRHPQVETPILEFLRKVGIPALSDVITTQARISGASESQPTQAMKAWLVQLRDKRFEQEFPKRAAEFEVSHELRHDWRERILAVKKMLLAEQVSATLVLGGRSYTVAVSSGFDCSSGVLWIMTDADDPEQPILEALSERIFIGVKKSHPWVLKGILSVRDPRGMHENEHIDTLALHKDEDAIDEDVQNEDLPGTPQPDVPATPTRDLRQTHRPSPQERTLVIPKPSEIPVVPPARREPSERPRSGQAGATAETLPKIANQRPPDELEKLQIDSLKEEHYAWHCQVCLAVTSPAILAPPASYAEATGNRAKLIEAHHVDQVHGGGARHAGNLLIVCHRHHMDLGDVLTRDDVTNALETARPATVLFEAANGPRKVQQAVSGYQAIIKSSTRSANITCFFTEYHREFWLRLAAK